MHSTLPVSAGLLHDVERYMKALDAYHVGKIEPIIACFADALELAVVIGLRIADDVNDVLSAWRASNTDRAGSASHGLPELLVEQPVRERRICRQPSRHHRPSGTHSYRDRLRERHPFEDGQCETRSVLPG